MANRFWLGFFGIVAAFWATSVPARSAPGPSPVALPPAEEVFSSAMRHRLRAGLSTHQRGAKELVVYANVPQELRLEWHVNAGGSAEVTARPAWRPEAAWRPLHTISKGSLTQRGSTQIQVQEPLAVRLRVRGPAWPASGISRLKIDYSRATVAVLRGAAHLPRRPVLVVEGIDLQDNLEANDASWDTSGRLARLVTEGRERYGLDPWLLDWGCSGAPIEVLAAELAEVLREVRRWNGGRRETTLLGLSMGAVVAREAMVTALETGNDLGLCKFVSLNGPHRGAWLSPELSGFLRKHGPGSDQRSALADPTCPSPLDRPSTRQLLVGNPECAAFFLRLRARGQAGYDPRIERVAFTNGTFGNTDDDPERIVERAGRLIQKTTVRPLYLPISLRAGRIRSRFEFDEYPGDRLLSEAFDSGTRLHFNVFTAGRMDVRSRFRHSPTFISTHSALDFPGDLERWGTDWRYARRGESPFQRVYVARRTRGHLDLDAEWSEPGRTGVIGNALLAELAH